MSETREFSWRYPAVVLGTAIVALLAFLGLLAGLERTGHLPPPALTNSLCVDEKLAFLRDHAVEDSAPAVLAVGSSVAWRHFDGAAVEERHPGTRVLNGGFCGLPMHQSAFVSRWLIDRIGPVHEVVAIVAPQDFADCRTSPATVFDTGDADDFLDRRGPPLFWFYLRYFEPFSLLRNAGNIAAQRTGRMALDPFVMDRWGDAPLDTELARGDLVYGPIERLDPACFGALHDLSRWLEARQIRLVVATTPIHPEWRQRFDPDGRLLAAFDTELRRATGTGEVWAGHRLAAPGADAFTDAIHLRWSAARAFSRALVEQTSLGDGNGAAASGDATQDDSRRRSHRPAPHGTASAGGTGEVVAHALGAPTAAPRR